MYGQLRLSDYRCFRREAPATLVLAPGNTSFIGANNAGKTALLRALWELRQPLSQILGTFQNTGADLSISAAGKRVPFNGNGLPDFDDIVAERKGAQTRIDVIVEPNASTMRPFVKQVSLVFPTPNSAFELELYINGDLQIFPRATAGSLAYQSHNESQIAVQEIGHVDLRPMVGFLKLITKTMYVGSFRNPINAGGGHPYFDVQVGSNFISSWHAWQNGSKLQRTALHTLVQRVQKMMNLPNLTVTSSPERSTLLTEIGGRHGKLSDLGSGIAHVLITLANALIQEPSLIAIDEPETGLHPALQRSFIEALGEVAPYGVLYTTHSMGLARTEADRCFTVHRIGDDSKVRLYEKTGHLAEVLGSMGIAAFQELAYTRLLLVEGLTEVRVFKQFLARYGLERDTVVFSLGGSTLINGKVAEELLEVQRICPDVRAIVDSERAQPDSVLTKDRSGFATVCGGLKIPCLVTDRRATDNYFTQAAIDSAFGQGAYSCLEAHEALKGRWGKSDNWRIAAHMTKDELDQTDIGRFLANWAG